MFTKKIKDDKISLSVIYKYIVVLVFADIYLGEKERIFYMRYIESLREGDKISDIYMCKNRQSLTTKNGKAYDSVILQDKTGTVDAKIWDPNSQGIDDFDSMDYIEIVGDVVSFQGALQVNIKRLRKCSEGEYDQAEYFPVSEKSIDEMFEEFLGYIKSVKNKYLSELLNLFFVNSPKIAGAFKEHSAAKTVHHGFIGGLLEHTLGVVKLCDFYCKNYSILNRDLLITVAALHDIGKIKELSAFPANDYTDEGQLLGHIVIGSEWISDAVRQIPDFPPKLARELKHCILAHHGKLEYGSPKMPSLCEAVALNYADDTDAKMQTMKEIFEAPSAMNGDWIGYNRLFETNMRKTTDWE